MNHTKVWKLPQLTEVEFFKAQFTDFTYAPHFHEDYAIGVVETGIHAFYYRGENHAVVPDYVVTCQPGEVHNGYPGSELPWCYRMLYIQPTLICQVAKDCGYQSAALPFLRQTSFNHPYIVQALRTMHQQSEQHEPSLSVEVQLREILALVLAKYSDIHLQTNRIKEERTPITRTKLYMQEHYAEDIQLDDLARVAQLSKSYLIRAFHHYEGLSPYAYLIQLRLNRAKALLTSGLSGTVVAQETGFFDQSHFNRYFKRFLGMTPGHYQQAIG